MGKCSAIKRSQKSGSQRVYSLRSLRWLSPATKNSYFGVMVYHVILDISTNPSYAYSLSSYSFLTFLCIGSSLIQGTATFTAVQGCGYLYTKSKHTDNIGPQNSSSPLQPWRARQFSRSGRRGGPVVKFTLQLSKCHQGVKMHWSQERR